MNRRFNRPCRHWSCPSLTRNKNGYCEQHQEKVKQVQRTTNRKSNKRASPFYGTKRWQLVRDRHISLNPLCCGCGRIGREVDHINPISQGGGETDPTNLQTLCRSCHASKTYKENKDNH